MADHHDGGALLDQVALQPLDRLHIQVVGGLIEQQQVGILQQDLAQGDAHLPAARVVGHQLLGPLGCEADCGQQLVDAGIELIAVQGFEALMQPAQLVDQLLQVIRIAGGLLAGHLMLHRMLAVEHHRRLAEGLEQLLTHGALGIDVEFLLHVGDARRALLHHLTAAGLLQAGDDPQLGGFAGAVDAHQPDAIARLHLPGDIAQHLPGGIDLAEAFETEHGESC